MTCNPRIEHVGANSTSVYFDGIKSGWEQWILLRSDVHHDSPKCDWKLERKHLDEAKEHNALIIDNGDLFCAMQGKWDKRSNKDSIREEHSKGNYLDALVETAAEFYKPYAKNFIVLGRGNHETAIRGRHETDLTDRLAYELRRAGSKVIAGGYGGWIRFLFEANKTKRSSKVLYHYHGTGGGGPVTRGTIQTSRIAVFTPDADIVLTGHTHDSWMVPIARQRISQAGHVYHDEQYHIRCAGYKDAWGDGSHGWEVEKMLGPKPKDSAWLRFYWDSTDAKVKIEISRAT
jgi:predicted phosphodiesterase